MSGSALAEYAWDSSHDNDWDSCKIVDKEIHSKKRQHLECFYKGHCFLTETKGLFLALIQHYFIQREKQNAVNTLKYKRDQDSRLNCLNFCRYWH